LTIYHELRRLQKENEQLKTEKRLYPKGSAGEMGRDVKEAVYILIELKEPNTERAKSIVRQLKLHLADCTITMVEPKDDESAGIDQSE
jgi:hypothetical protein